MFDITLALPAKRKQTASGWISFNAPCCYHRGERADTRGRGGIIIEPDGSFRYHCFNCNFKTAFKTGERLSFNTKKLLAWLGVDEATIDMLQLEALRYRTLNGLLPDEPIQIVPKTIHFPEIELPNQFRQIDPDNPDDQPFVSYLTERSIRMGDYPFLIDPSGIGRNKNRIILPYTYNGTLVGYTSRYLDGKVPKYIHEMPHGYVFGTDLQKQDWQRAIVVEGVFDAIAINGLAVLHNAVNEDQARVITKLQREIIVVPDRDKAGQELIDRAVELNWSVSMPEWGDGIKDVADAVKKYGRLATLITIIDAAESSPLRIKLKRRKFAEGIQH